ncbi:MAG: TlpA disulfide reductase family protein [Pseudomonadota bacterium]
MFSARHLLTSLVLFALPGLTIAAEPPLQFSHTPFKPRITTPAMTLKDMDGKTVELARLRGKVVIVNFWATWCPPCRREFPSMERLRQKMEGKPVVILGVNEGETVDMIDQFNSTLDLQPQFPILLDLDGEAMRRWPVRGLPTTFFVDKRGRLAHGAIGGREFDHPEMLRLIESMLAEQ